MDQQSTSQPQAAFIAPINLFPVESSQLACAGYNPDARTLGIIFKGNDRVYHYHNVAPEVYEAFQGSESKGKFFYSRIKNQYGFTRIEADGEVSKIEPAPYQIGQDGGGPESATTTEPPAQDEQQAA